MIKQLILLGVTSLLLLGCYSPEEMKQARYLKTTFVDLGRDRVISSKEIGADDYGNTAYYVKYNTDINVDEGHRYVILELNAGGYLRTSMTQSRKAIL